MIDDLKKLLGQASDPLDLATILVFGTAGFVIDAGFNAVGFLDPGYVGVTAASGALGLKKAAEAAWAARRARARALRLLDLLIAKNYPDLVRQLERDIELFNTGIVGVESLKLSIDETIKAYRSGKRSSRESSVTPGRFETLELDEDN